MPIAGVVTATPPRTEAHTSHYQSARLKIPRSARPKAILRTLSAAPPCGSIWPGEKTTRHLSPGRSGGWREELPRKDRNTTSRWFLQTIIQVSPMLPFITCSSSVFFPFQTCPPFCNEPTIRPRLMTSSPRQLYDVYHMKHRCLLHTLLPLSPQHGNVRKG